MGKKALAIATIILLLVVAFAAGNILLNNRPDSSAQNGASQEEALTEDEIYEDWAPIIPGRYDPSDEAYYYEPEGKVAHEPKSGTEYKTFSWSSNMVYLHDVTKNGLLDLVGKHLENLEQALDNQRNSADDSPWGVGSEWYNETELKVTNLRTLKNELGTIEENDTERLRAAYNQFHEILRVHEQEK